ncbi:SMP-30/gluconolactonase/LRE family protein [Hyphobacterium marinum]|uniref:SMP-30/Gluconolactonase/LRE-like region domain-containing protein n=1 Tax=Hyphobacterium marinum TaxID=3116574 RepID=A0ABU7LUV7_9PROT|nr:hypothetical protein [Hyphobacterium sp. Y6023]MEE2565347.1 hypothetical protein [Hyphobacterium sp. Y6023]
MRSLIAGILLYGTATTPVWAQDAGALAVTLEPVWRTGGFENPESALFVSETGFLYVSNVAGEGGDVDGNGYISRMTLDGEIETLRWAEEGLNAPKGLARHGDRIYVTDITDIVEIDLATGAVLSRHLAEGSRFLNDAIAGADGTIYVSDSGTARIYQLSGGIVSVWAEDPLMAAANGLWLEEDRMLLITMAGRLVAIDRESRNVTEIATGIGDGDGIAPLPGGGYLGNEWPGQTYHIAEDGTVTVLEDVRADETYTNDFTIVGNRVYTPHFNSGEVSAADIVVND